MSWQAIMRKEVSDASRSLVLWVISALFLLFAVLVAGAFVLISDLNGSDSATALDAMVFIISPVSLFAPIIALLVGYKAIVGERESGSLKVLLALPHNRWDVMFGKLVGRSIVMAIPVAIAFLVMGVIISIFVELVAIDQFLILFVLSIFFAVAFVSIAIAISGAVGSSTVAGAAMFGVFATFFLIWDIILMGLNYLIEGDIFITFTEGFPEWYLFVDMLAPDGAYSVAAQGLLPGVDLYSNTFPSDVPIYLSEWAALLVLLAWLVVPFGLGYLRFRNADL